MDYKLSLNSSEEFSIEKTPSELPEDFFYETKGIADFIWTGKYSSGTYSPSSQRVVSKMYNSFYLNHEGNWLETDCDDTLSCELEDYVSWSWCELYSTSVNDIMDKVSEDRYYRPSSKYRKILKDKEAELKNLNLEHVFVVNYNSLICVITNPREMTDEYRKIEEIYKNVLKNISSSG